MIAAKRLVVNADDFGFTRDVNEGIVEAHQKGILTAATLMANGAAFDHAVQLARRHTTLDVGCHLVLVGGDSLLPPYRPLPASIPRLLAAIAARRIHVYEELKAQAGKIVAAGIAPSHIDTHKHTHLAPPVLNAVARIAREFAIPWVRRPFDLPFTASTPWLTRTASAGLRVVRRRFERVLQRHGCRMTDHFAGFQITGRFRTEELVRLIHSLPDGLTELMCHPGHCTAELRGARTRLKDSREAELQALVAAETRQAIEECGVEVVNYRGL